jgi:hypothetical protein
MITDPLWDGQGLGDVVFCDGGMSPEDVPRPIPGFQRDLYSISGLVNAIWHAQYSDAAIEVMPNMESRIVSWTLYGHQRLASTRTSFITL